MGEFFSIVFHFCLTLGFTVATGEEMLVLSVVGFHPLPLRSVCVCVSQPVL